MANLFKRLRREGQDALRPGPGDEPGQDWFCLVIYLIAGVCGLTILFGCIALAQMLLSFWK